MIITANIATYPARAESLKRMLKSIEGQFDEVRICYNESTQGNESIFAWNYCKDSRMMTYEPDINLTDNGKFYALDVIKEPEYYFTLDDDLIYPPDYVKKTIKALQMYGGIITHHGRILNGLDLDYYYAHQIYPCLQDVHTTVKLDVCGTGVTAFDTRNFHPKGLAHSKDKRMSDLIFSLEAAKQNKQIGIIPHKTGWIKAIDNKETIHDTETRNGYGRQNQIANEIWKLRYQHQ